MDLSDSARSVLEAASTECGLDDFGPPDFLPSLEAWLREAASPQVTDVGRAVFAQTAQRCLVNRARFARDLAAHPEILDEDISDPIIVLGFPRSGTTVLQRMLSADPSKQSMLLWRVLNPAPFPGEDPAGRIAFAEAVEQAMRTHQPAMFAAHPIFARDAEEDWYLHHFGFGHVANICLGLFTPSYLAYLRGLPRQSSYDYAGDLMRYLQWQDGGKRGRPWILKSPAHIGYLEEMLKVHPKATFVYPRRDFRTVMASFCYTLEMYAEHTINLDPRAIGALSMDLWAGEMKRFHDARRRLGPRLKLMEIPYLELVRDPLPQIGAIHELAGLKLSSAGEGAIRRWIADNPQNKHGQNVYSLDRYGLTPEQVDEAFGEFETL